MISFLLAGDEKITLTPYFHFFRNLFPGGKITSTSLREVVQVARNEIPDVIVFVIGSAGSAVANGINKLKTTHQTRWVPLVVTCEEELTEDVKALEKKVDALFVISDSARLIRSQIQLLIRSKQLEKKIDRLNDRFKKSKCSWEKRNEALKEQERFRTIIHRDAPVALWLLDVEADGNFRYIYQNEEAMRSGGFSDDLVIGKRPQDLVPDILKSESAEHLLELYRKCVKSKQLVSTEWMVEIAGQKTWWKTFISPVFTPDGKVYRLLTSNVLITGQKKVEEKLRQSEDSYRSLFEHNPQPMWIYDSETFAFLKVNQAAVNHYGYTEEEFLSMTIKDIRPAEEVSRLLHDAVIKQDKYRHQGEWRHLKKNGEVIVVEVVSHSTVFDNRKSRHVIINDITENKKTLEELEEKNKALKQAQAIAKMGSWQYDLVKQKVAWSANNYRIYGFEPNEIEPDWSAVFKFLHPDDLYVVETSYQELLETKKALEVEYRLVMPDKTVKWIHSTFVPVFRADELVYLEGVNIDVTERKNFETALIKAKNKAEESERLKSAFLANMSHEIRTPMNGILGFLSVLDNPDLEEDIQKEYIDVVKRSGQRLMDTIGDIVELSRLESGEAEVTLSETDVSSILKNQFDYFFPQAEKKGLRIILSTTVTGKEAVVLTDSQKVNGILTNLIKNALKFTDKGFVEFGNYQKKNQLIFFVKDTGKGIPADCLQMIFHRFTQADMSLARMHEGAGIGLAISKALVESLRGKIWVESEEGKGSTFFFSIPYEKVNSEVESMLRPERHPLSVYTDLTILVAEDDEISFQLLNALLTKYQFNVLRAVDGEDCVNTFLSNPRISVVLMDLRMPGKDGFAATRAIRKMNGRVPVIAQSALAFPADREKAFRAGCNDFILKPVNEKQLIDMIVKYLEPDNWETTNRALETDE